MNHLKTTILYIEDNIDHKHLLEDMLKEINGNKFELICCEDLSTGLELLKDREIDLVLLDLGLPETKGIETFNKVHPLAADIPIIVLTSLDDRETAIKAAEKGAQDYLLKGHIDPFSLERSIRYAIERKQLEKKLVQATKMEAVGNLAGGIAHDFNNYLTSIIGYLDMLQREHTSDSAAIDYIDHIWDASKRAQNLTQQILSFSRRAMIKPKVINLNHLIENFKDILKSMLGKDVILEILPLKDLGNIEADPNQIEQVIMNLAVNAREAMPNGGKLVIQTKDIDNTLEISIQDTGIGIPKEKLKNLFNPFYTTKEKGTGLGLFIVHQIIENNKG